MPKEKSRFPVVQNLYGLRKNDNRQAIAIIRRGLQVSLPDMMSTPMARFVWPYLPPDVSYREKQTAFLVAALFADYCAGKGREPVGEQVIGDFGSTMRKVWELGDKTPSFEQRFTVLIDSSFDALIYHLRPVVHHARTNVIPINWDKLYEHVRAWEHVSRYVQSRWAESFWRSYNYIEQKKLDEATTPA